MQNQHCPRAVDRPSHRLLPQFAALLVGMSLVLGSGAAEPAPKPPPPAVTELPPNVVAQHIVLSYTDPARCVDMLKAFGYRIVEAGKPVNPAELPSVMLVPSTKFSDLPKPGGKPFPQTETDPVSNLLVFFDSTQPDQLSHLLRRIRTVIDTPARQIMIEAMVLEISSGALAQLGVQWDLDRTTLSDSNWLGKHTSDTNTEPFRIGHLALPDGTSIADATLDGTLTNVFGHFEAQLKALVMDQSARILSRPSILTLDNRMAYINVAEVIPVPQSKFSGSNYFTQVSFTKENAGIELTVRPRVSEDGGEVGMQIAANVTARKPGEDVVVYGTDSKGNQFEVARSPTLTVREVQTFARVANSTPFIIGGLIAEDDQQGERRVPFLGKIPLIGGLFRTKETEGGRREVIIVITPNVLPENKTVARMLPKDTDDFDNFGAKLFRDAYRIRAEDVFNLEFLTENHQLRQLQEAVDRVLRDHQQLAKIHPFSSFCDRRIPGEDILVSRQIYEVVKRRGIEEPMDDQRLIFLTSEGSDSQVGVDWLAKCIHRLSKGQEGLRDLLDPEAEKDSRNMATKALALTFVEHRDSGQAQDAFMEPVPEVKVVDCPGRGEWEELLWEMNQPTENGRRRHTILLRDERDITRLKRAIVVRKAAELNVQGDGRLSLRDFAIGRILLMPTVKEDKTHLIDMEVAEHFFYTNHYYRAVAQELDAEMKTMSETLQKPEYRKYEDPAE